MIGPIFSSDGEQPEEIFGGPCNSTLAIWEDVTLADEEVGSFIFQLQPSEPTIQLGAVPEGECTLLLRPHHQRKPPNRLGEWQYLYPTGSFAAMAQLGSLPIPLDPQTYQEAVQSLNATH